MTLDVTVGSVGAQENTLRTKVHLTCVLTLTFFHFIACYAVWIVIPYHVLSTPENGWTISDLSIIFVTFNLGSIAASQICGLAESSTKWMNTIIFVGHLTQFISGIIGFVIMSSIFGFNKSLFFFGAFLAGICNEYTITQSYGRLISTDDKIQKQLLSSIANIAIVAAIVNSFLLLAIYEQAGFQIFCGSVCAMEAFAILVLLVLWHGIAGQSGREGVIQVLGCDPRFNVVEIPLLKLLSPSVYCLLFIQAMVGLTGAMYWAAHPIVFVTEFGIGSVVAGYLSAAGGVFSFIVLSVIVKNSKKFKVFQYPFDILLLALVYAIGNAAFIVFDGQWVAYSFHWIILGLCNVMRGCESVSRLDLCPPAAFSRITSIAGALRTVGYLSGSALGAMLCTVSTKLPFMVVVVLEVILAVVIFMVYIRRVRYLSTFHDEDVSYLIKEKAHYNRMYESYIRGHGLTDMGLEQNARDCPEDRNNVT